MNGNSVDVSLADVCAFLEQGLSDDEGVEPLPESKRLRLDFGLGPTSSSESSVCLPSFGSLCLASSPLCHLG